VVEEEPSVVLLMGSFGHLGNKFQVHL